LEAALATDVMMPRLGYEMVEGLLLRWLKNPGDAVAVGEVIAEVETDKAIVEITIEHAGVLTAILVEEGTQVPVGQPIATVDASNTQAPPAPAPRSRSADAAPPPRGMRVGFPPRLPGADGRIDLGKMGQAIARRTGATNQETPLFYLTAHVDMTDAVTARHELNNALATDQRVSLNDMILKACTLALLKFPVFNSTFEEDHLRVNPHVNMGVAIALPAGLIVPAVLECERKSLVEIARDAKDLVTRAKDGKLHQDEYTGTFSVSNLGMYDVEAFTAIVVSPQVGVLAVGAVRPTPMAKGGAVVVRQTMYATLSTDHRAANGAEAAQFAAEIKRLLQDPGSLIS